MVRTSWRHETIVRALFTHKLDGITTMRLAQTLGMERHTMAKHLHFLEIEGIAIHRKVGAATLWYPSSPLQSGSLSSALPLTRQLLAQVTEEVPTGFAIVDHSLMVCRANAAFQEVYGGLGKAFAQTLTAKPSVSLRKLLLRQFDSGVSASPELKDKFDSLVRLTITRLNGDKPLLIILVENRTRLCSIRDELASALAAIKDSEQIICITDSKGSIEYVNEAFEKSSGYTQRELLGKNPRVLKSGVYGREFYERLWKTIKAGKTFQEIFIDKKKNGELYYEEKKITPVTNERGTITHYVSTGRASSSSK